MSKQWDSKLRSKEIVKIRRRGRKHLSPLFLSYVTTSNETHQNKVIIAASKKNIDKRAVLRNRAKRRIRGALDRIDWPAHNARMMIIIPRNKQILTVGFGEIVERLRQIIS